MYAELAVNIVVRMKDCTKFIIDFKLVVLLEAFATGISVCRGTPRWTVLPPILLED